MKKTLTICLSILILLTGWLPLGTAFAEEDPYAYTIEQGPSAENLTHHCKISSNLKTSAYTWRVTDGDFNSSQIFKAGQWVSLTWKEDVPVKAIWLAFKDYPGAYRVQQFDAAGKLLQEEQGSDYVNHAVFLEDATRSITVVSEEEINICSLYAYGEGNVPSYHPWEPTPEKLDYLIVAMHPDDDVLFMGAILPLYTVEQGREGTIFYTATRERVRKDEAGNGAWIMGLRKAPILGTFPDIPPSYMNKYKDKFLQKDVVKYLVGLFRRYRPEVVFSQDLNGEYGHWQHIILAHAVQEAVPLAADPTYDKKSAEQYGTWDIKKLYLHLYAENPIQLPVTKPIEAYGGLTPVEIATAAFQCHQSQLPSRHAVRNEGVYSMSDFGLAYTTVGLDTPGVNDPFEHVDPASLHSHSVPVVAEATQQPAVEDGPVATASEAPIPTDTPAPTPTESPLPTDTPAPTAVPTAEATPEATDLPSAAPDAQQIQPSDQPSADMDDIETGVPVWLLPILMGLAAILAVGLSFLSKRWWQRILLWVAALLLSLCAALLLVSRTRANARMPAASPTPTEEPVYELTFTTDTLPDPAALAAYPDLKTLDVTACEQVTPSWYTAIRQMVPADCRVLWSVPLTDGRFPYDSRELTLPHLSPDDVTTLACFENLTAVDASGSTAYDALLRLREIYPDLSLTFTLPVGDQVLTMDAESLTVRETPDFALLQKMLPAFPKLRELDLTDAAVDPAEAAALMEGYPELTIRYTVPVGSLRVPPDAVSLALKDSGIETAEELLPALAYLPELKQLDLHGTGLTLADLSAILAARPDLLLYQTVELFGQTVETDAAELDLREADGDAETLLPLLRPFARLEKVYLPQTSDAEATAGQLRAEHPETAFIYQVTVFGQTVESTVEELDISKTVFSSPEQVKAELPRLPFLRKLIMCDCKLSNEQMEELQTAFPQIKFVWTIHLAHHAIRTDAIAFSTKNPTKHTQSYYSDHVNKWIKTAKRLKAGDLKELKYCTDLVALDLGHNYLTSEDLEVLQYLPHLQVLILADNKITDISALSYLKELQYVELFMNRIPDMSPLVGLPDLTDINIANTHLEDITPLLHFTAARRLWFSMNGLTSDQNKQVKEALPDCVCNYTTRNETAEGWREGERYQWMKAFFDD